jgi:hypothetical protein
MGAVYTESANCCRIVTMTLHTFISIACLETLGFPQCREVRNSTVMSRSFLFESLSRSCFAAGRGEEYLQL